MASLPDVRDVFRDARSIGKIPKAEITSQLQSIDRHNKAQTDKAMATLRQYIETDVKKFQVGAALQSLGNWLVEYARKTHAFRNRTGRLERSIAWVFSAPDAIVFYAGMWYAAQVEARGYWVLSGAWEQLTGNKEKFNWMVKRAMNAASRLRKVGY